jgi:hypothetical protein
LPWPPRGWAIDEDDFGPEDDDREGEKQISLQTFSFRRELQPEKHTLPGIQWITWTVVEKSSSKEFKQSGSSGGGDKGCTIASSH